ncbi:MAG: tRNA lysidine(34) synthetase TilS [Butyrivibrio sp.]|nr:tRNA lysidine(34) synthetase TilS [Butyrivibrio sp.]MBQ8031268.1 tRNA lysidine(34) synthetase TilS [Butyrivibrio sp.]MBR1641917.1 tRNA lysidine(34) synthetase TilS [Butyrivibrio sp.]
MDKFSNKVLNYIQKNGMFPEGARVVVGFSGGGDSTALLTVLEKLQPLLKIELFAIHINHLIRSEAGEDEEFCRSFCKERGISFVSRSVDIPLMAKEKSLTEEEAGRIARYEAFSSYAKEISAGHIAVAHHQNDVAETLLMNLLRGSGLHGGAAIRPVRDNIVRPLLCVTRAEIEEYLKESGISFCTDKTNLESIHTRNFLRNEILPELEKNVNDRTIQHLCAAAVSFDKADEYIREVAGNAFDRIVTSKDGSVCADIRDILLEKEIIRENIVLLMFEALVKNRKDIGAVHVEEVLDLLKSEDGQASVDLPYGLCAKRTYGRLEISQKGNQTKVIETVTVKPSVGEETQIVIPELGRVTLSVFSYDKQKEVPTWTYTKWFDYDRIQEVSFRTRRGDDKISISQGDAIHQKLLSKFMTDKKIPKDKRDEMVIVADGNSVLWVPGYRISASCKVSEATRYILEIKIDDGGMSNG